MSNEWQTLRINEPRFKKHFYELSRIGAVGERGVNRPALSLSHLEARAWFHRKAKGAGLDVRVDGAGNHSAVLACGPEGAKTLLLGSHLDSVPNGGSYDGALGVLAALEALHRVKETELHLPYHLEAIDFTDEEGTLVSFLGSLSLCGLLTRNELENPRGDRRELLDGLARSGLSEDSVFSAQLDPDTLAGYLELHVEQGPELEQARLDIGIVERIAGIAFYRLRFLGTAGHAGTVPMEDRKDAAQGAAAFTMAARQVVLDNFQGSYSNVGSMSLEPGLFNIVPEVATLDFECRSAYEDQFRTLEAALIEQSELAGEKFGLSVRRQLLGVRPPAQLDKTMGAAIRSATESLCLSQRPMIARAGHDAQPISTICPTGMIFVPSKGGISHSPEEYTTWEDCVNGANVLLQSIFHHAFRPQ